MAANTEGHGSGVDRSKRIRFLRRLILITIAASCLIPTMICVILAIQLNRSVRTLDKAKTELAWYEEQFGENVLSDGEGRDADTKHVSGEADADNDLNEQDGSGGVETSEVSGGSAGTGADISGGESLATAPLAAEDEWDGTRRVYITFDDGPSTSTNAILDILDQYGVKATFFVTGKEGEEYAQLYNRIVQSGHTLGMHSFSHRYSELYESLESFSMDLHKLQTFLYETTGVWSQYYRFPGGSSNTVSKVPMSELVKYMGLTHIQFYDWNVASSDDRSGIDKDIIIANVMTGVQKHNDAIILLHDATDKPATVEALPEIIEQIQAMDNTVIVPITEDTLPVQHISNSQ
ncbi:polysaccharide deacetylase family protein [Butyrivibrio sp. AE3004]|uniref:polysaccharide deacetylase family protein n=1 Tax=Butyrivibrio sp. AE3004 TaxID=1506994 RepID=UPI0018CC581B|nr:polysaccharide deacetylase family protein [Butyrivibrio sp. AE3004]